MSILKNPAFEALQTGYTTLFNDAFGSAEKIYQQYVTTISSSTKIETHTFMLDMMKMREWVGPRDVKNMEQAALAIQNKRFEGTVEVDLDDLADDVTGNYAAHFTQLGIQAGSLGDELAAAALEAGLTTVGYDGVVFFDTGHEASQSNKLTVALDAPGLTAAIGKLKGFKHEGKPLANGRKMNLVVAPAQEFTAKALVNASINASGATNILQGAANVIVNPYLTDDTRWYVLDNSSAIKPVCLQVREDVNLKPFDPNGEHAIRTNKWLWTANARMAAFTSLWFLAVTSKA